MLLTHRTDKPSQRSKGVAYGCGQGRADGISARVGAAWCGQRLQPASRHMMRGDMAESEHDTSTDSINITSVSYFIDVDVDVVVISGIEQVEHEVKSNVCIKDSRQNGRCMTSALRMAGTECSE